MDARIRGHDEEGVEKWCVMAGRSRSKNGVASLAYVPAIHVFMLLVMERGGFVYFMTNRRNGIIYVGVTSNLLGRVYQHREGLVDGFTKRYGLKTLVYYERFDDIRDAIAREKAIKHWPRAWKVRLIHQMNPEWSDLYAALTP